MSDRGMKKWAPYASLIEQKGSIVKMKQSRRKVDRPLLSQEQASLINRHLLHAHHQQVKIIYFSQGEKLTTTGIVNKINFDEKWLQINQIKIVFSALLDLQFISPINFSPELFNE